MGAGQRLSLEHAVLPVASIQIHDAALYAKAVEDVEFIYALAINVVQRGYFMEE